MRRCVTIHMFLTATVIIATVLALISMALSGRAENLGPTITLPLWNQLDSTGKPALSSCHAEEHAEYFATSVVLWGSQNKKVCLPPDLMYTMLVLVMTLHCVWFRHLHYNMMVRALTPGRHLV